MSRRDLTEEMLADLRYPMARAPLHLSPDGAMLAVSSQGRRRRGGPNDNSGLAPVGVPHETLQGRVLVVDTASGRAWEPFPRHVASWAGQWSPDGSMLAAFVQRDEQPDEWPGLGIWHRGSGTSTTLRQAPVRPFFGFEVPRWTPDSRSVVVKLAPTPRPGDADTRMPSDGNSPGVTVFSFDPDGEAEATQLPGFAERHRCDLGAVNVASGDVRRLAVGWPLTGWKVAPDGHAVAVLRHASARPERQQFFYDLAVVPMDGGAPRTVVSAIPQGYGIGFNWSPDSTWIAYVTEERGEPGRLFLAGADGSAEPVELTDRAGLDLLRRPLDRSYEAPLWSRDGERVVLADRRGYREFSTDGGAGRAVESPADKQTLGWVYRPTEPTLWAPEPGCRLEISRDLAAKNLAVVRLDTESGERTPLCETEANWWSPPFGMEAAPDGSAVYLLLEAADHPPEVWRFGGDFRHGRRLYSFSAGLDRVAMGRGRLIGWRVPDGGKRQGAVLLPPGYEEGHPVPLIVDVYGGVRASHLVHSFGGGALTIPTGQLLAARGYAVLCPDLPLTDHDPMRQLPGLVLPAVNRLIELAIADPRRLGAMGHSYGGYCVLALLTQTDVFRPAVCSAGPVDLVSHYGTLTSQGDPMWTGWAETGQGRIGGSLWEKRDSYIENSPLFYLDRVTTPLLLVSGTAIPGEAAQAGEAFNGLRRLGKKVELRLYHGEDHSPLKWSEDSYRDRSARVLSWFDAHLRSDRPAAAE